MNALKFLVSTICFMIVAVGVFAIAAPSALLESGRSLLTPTALYAVAAIRVMFGALLLSVATGSRMPRTLRVIAVVIIIAGLLTPLFGFERSLAMIAWLSSQGLPIFRMAAGFLVIIGLFIVYVVNAPRRNDAMTKPGAKA